METIYKVIDNHVHIAGPGDKYPNDLYWSKKFKKGVGYKGLKILKGWIFKRVDDRLMIDELLKQAEQSKQVDYVLALAFDNVYKVDGTYCGPGQKTQDEVLSTLYVSNAFVKETLCPQNRKILPGISVHPFRDDAAAELEKYKDTAVLCKWMASAQQIDFSDPKGEPKLLKFYEKLAEIKLPLLFHTGVETSIPASKPGFDTFNSPIFIEKALDAGVTVILAHCGCSYFDILLPQDNVVQEVIRLFKKMQGEKKDWNLYADISALFSPFRKRKILDDIFKHIPASRLIYGSDFPNPAKGRKEFLLRPFLRFRRANLIDRYFKITMNWLKRYYTQGESFHILTNFHRLLVSLGRGNLIK
jgi:predicted TIM-barrel fold metal-dependent hydrolase